jgi:uncharacterized protein YdeI (YjbR/CyaY-like superfamily)
MEAKFFKTQSEFRKWLEENHDKETELIVGYYKVGSGRPSMTWSQSVDQALCFGWIDSIRRSIDSESYCNRFTPRRPTGIWSAINIAKVEELTKNGLMHPAGIAAYKRLNPEKSKIYSCESGEKTLPPEFEQQFRSDPAAWIFFEKQPPSYRKRIIHWILSGKQESTQLTRLEKLIMESKNGNRIY